MRKPITDKIIDILMFFVKKKKSIPNKGASNHHPDLLTSCNLLTATAKLGMTTPSISIINTIKKNFIEIVIKINEIA